MSFPIRVADVMSRHVETAETDSTAADAANRCTGREVGSLVVVDDDGDPVGIVTSADLVGALGTSDDPSSRPLGEVMSAPVTTVEADVPVDEAVATMTDRDIDRLVVVDDGEMVGLVSTDDVFHHVPQILHRQRVGTLPREEHRYRVRHETAYELDDWEFECACVDDTAVSIGDRVTFAKTIDDRDVRSFAAASGDTNRLHLEDDYAAETRFGRRIVHGTLVAGLVSAALARLPGLTIYLSQDLTFLAPVDVGDRVSAVCTVVESLGRSKYQLATDVFGPDDERVIEGEAAVLIDELPTPGRVEFEAVS
jgi:acyl dehydratase/CBS domain-containing protein